MLKPVLLTLLATLGLFLLSFLCRAAGHTAAVRRRGLGTTVVIGKPNDPQLPTRVYTSFLQSTLLHLEPPDELLVLDCGLTPDEKSACLAALCGKAQLRFVTKENLCDYLVASAAKKEYNGN